MTDFKVTIIETKAVVKRIIDGSIINYRIDNTTGQLVKKERTSD